MSARGGRVRIMGMAFDAITADDAVEHVVSSAMAGAGGFVVTANVDHLLRARTDGAYAGLVEEADLVVADGMPIVWASRVAGRPVPERIAGSAMIEPLVAALAARGGSVFLLGGNPGVADRAAEIFRTRYEGVRIAGTACPEFGFERDEGAIASLRDAVGGSRPHLVLVALGSPKQEILIRRLRGELACEVPGAWWIGIGIGLSFVTGDVRRAPGWMQRWGLEWVHRLAMEPGRLAKRYLVSNLPFGARLMAGAVAARVRGGEWT